MNKHEHVKKRWWLLTSATLLSALLASCGSEGAKASSSYQSAAFSSAVATSEVASSGAGISSSKEDASSSAVISGDGELVVATLDSNQAVGSELDMREYVKKTVDGTFSLRSRNNDVVRVCDDGYTLAFVGEGTGRVVVTSGEESATLQFRALTGNRLKAEATIAALRDEYSMIGILYETDSSFQSYTAAYGASIVCGKDYVFDGFYDSYSAVRLNKDGVSANYDFTLLDEEGEQVLFPEYASQVSVTPETKPDEVIDEYFVHANDVVNIEDFTDVTTAEDEENGLVSFETYDEDTTLRFLFNLYNMEASNYEGVYSYLCVDTAKNVMAYQINIMYTYYDSNYGYTDFGFMSFVGTVELGAPKIGVLDAYIASGAVPEYADTAALKEKFHAIQAAKNYSVVLTSDVPDYSVSAVEYVMTVRFTESAVLYEKVFSNTGAVAYFGFLNEDGKVYEVDYDSSSASFVKGEEKSGYADYRDYIATHTWNDGTTDIAYQGNIMAFTDAVVDSGKLYQNYSCGENEYLSQGNDDAAFSKVWMDYVMGFNPFSTYEGLPLEINYTEKTLGFSASVETNFSSSASGEWDFSAMLSNVGTTTISEFQGL